MGKDCGHRCRGDTGVSKMFQQVRLNTLEVNRVGKSQKEIEGIQIGF